MAPTARHHTRIRRAGRLAPELTSINTQGPPAVTRFPPSSIDVLADDPPRGRLTIGVVGAALSTLFVLSYTLYIGALTLAHVAPFLEPIIALLLPHSLLPGLGGFGIGLVRCAALGWFVAAVFCPLYNFYARQMRQ
jgi:hypothetical protein